MINKVIGKSLHVDPEKIKMTADRAQKLRYTWRKISEKPVDL